MVTVLDYVGGVGGADETVDGVGPGKMPELRGQVRQHEDRPGVCRPQARVVVVVVAPLPHTSIAVRRAPHLIYAHLLKILHTVILLHVFPDHLSVNHTDLPARFTYHPLRRVTIQTVTPQLCLLSRFRYSTGVTSMIRWPKFCHL